MKIRSARVLGGFLIAAAALTAGACANSSDDDAATTTTVSNAAQPSVEPGGEVSNAPSISGAKPSVTPQKIPATPTAAELNDKLKKAFDKSVSSDEKKDWVQYGDRDPSLVDNLADAATKNNVTVDITKVNPPQGTTLTANADVTIAGDKKPMTIDFVAENGEWKVSNKFACDVVKAAGLTSAACQIPE